MLGVPSVAAAQSGDTPDFLFGRPRASIGLRGSWQFARAGSDLFRFVEENLTIDRKDFNAPSVAADLGIRVTERIDAVFGVDVSQKSIASEYRHLVDNNRQPITQSTRLREVNLGGSVRVALTPRGRGISRFAWIPARGVPNMKITIAAALCFASLIAAPAHAQQPPDASWAPWLGCWQLVEENQGDATLDPAEGRGASFTRRSRNDVSVCATRASEPAGITLKTLVHDQPALEQTIITDGAVHSLDEADCRGTQRAEWSRAMRLFSSAELVCGNQPRTISGLHVIARGRGVDVPVLGIA